VRSGIPENETVRIRSGQAAACNTGAMASLDPTAWHDFFVGSMGASAALTGLLFVAISINLEQILKFPNLPGRAAGSLGVLVSALVVACCGLVPRQSHVALGVEIALAGGVVMVQAVWVSVRNRTTEGDTLSWRVERMVTLLLPGTLFFAGGLSLIADGGGGLYWIFAGTALAFVVSALNAWVLLVEVLR
jgi:modulator of FtsH protease